MAFRINYSKVYNQADSILEDANRLSAQIKLLDQLEQECKKMWKGPAADVFLKKLYLLREDMSMAESQMSMLASTIKYCANRIELEDRNTIGRATNLSSGH